ncbi:MAG: cysteine desulfurase CsdA [Piscirickettsiaceae bacterium CG_4_9_14_3_um_filter_43_564]|nr:cysteine desulfurase [Thiomicrospira sp.]OIP95407.1 MAG: cysteine sulfinate desulfinase [Thiomicrospira sp. CG2_30_44_34]PIQ03303.1 MAG: cysteine desulfurase CsdA [Piscirickettsiaceae bacterium CG18_big_fil_WC_8_21_14_2_50_44_103]PIU37919.1 MAG: cysteine desulfurase CsdA [Piscirickettsiaceae bacterium CG07_land_8_20_14_0_80_44_28]PIW58394.1 MAG: cysteine desulfurase CsdA [Piscirickettsiaceae bacterium CG12_big_fil_rev_8_21_14_0_65_44_934]PIW77194.1 MAG: cysteine desulfurase CsdA [Pisciricke
MNFTDIRNQFPLLKQLENGHPLVYLDNGATSQKPQVVIDRITQYYVAENANVHRGVYGLSERATEAYEGSREKIRQFLNAASTKEVIFVRGTTEAINLVAQTWGRQNLQAGDEVLITEMEHHSNIVPWQMLRDALGVVLKVLPINDLGEISLKDFEQYLTAKTKLVSVVHMSNALGTINPVKAMTEMAHNVGAVVLVDGAQAVPHMTVDVQDIGCDFYAFSGHKVYGPTGIGVLYGKEALLEAMPPYQGGGDMIYSVTFEETQYNVLPYKFEAGTPNMAGVMGLGAAIDFVNKIGLANITAYEQTLLQEATKKLSDIPGLKVIGQAADKGAVISFVIEGAHPHDMATLMDQEGVAVRASHHCAMPVMQRFQVPATIRASFGVYNHSADIDRLIAAIYESLDMLR